MPNLTKETLQFYQSFAKNNLNFLTDVESDLDFEAAGGKIVYAIDFSEVYGYSMGAAESFFFERGGDPFSDDIGKTTLFELHEAILEHILFEQEEHYLLLPPYSIELFNFIRRLNNSTAKEIAERTVAVAQSVTELKGSEEYNRLCELSQSDSVLERNSSDNHEFRTLFLNAVPDLVELWRDTKSPKPIDKAKSFLQQPFSQVSEIVPGLSEPDLATFQHWFSELNAKRSDRENQNYLDAQALGFIYGLNAHLDKSRKPTRVVLISRSKVLYDLAQRDGDRWERVGGQPIRHPRSFLNQISSLGTISKRKNEKEKRRNVEWWKRTYEAISGQRVFPGINRLLTPTEVTNRSLAVLIDVWKRFCSAQVSSRVIQNEVTTDDILLKALYEMNASGDVTGLFDAVLVDLHQELDKIHFNIPAALFAGNELEFFGREGRGQPIEAVSSESDVGERVIVSSLYGSNLSYSIHLKSNKLKNIIRDNAQDPYAAMQAVTGAARYNAKTDSDLFHAEWFLAIAYLYASMSAWEAAANSVKMAGIRISDLTKSRQKERDTQTTLFEVSYLASKCSREIGGSIELLEQTTQGLENAIKSFEKARKLPGKNRYLTRARTEKIKCIFELLERGGGDSKQLIDRIVVCIDRCRKNIKESKDPITEIQFLNDFCYHVLGLQTELGEIFPLKEVARDFTRFVILSEKVYGLVDSWPENYLDTLCWVSFNLAEAGCTDSLPLGLSRADIQRLASLNASKNYISEHDKKDFLSHKNYIDKAWG